MPDYWNHNTAFHDELVADAATRGGRALDVGCGDGLLVERLVGVCQEAVGVEVDPAAVARARTRLAGTSRASVVAADALSLEAGLKQGGFQTVTCVAVLHHLPLAAGLRRLAGLVAPGGRLLVVGLAANRGVGDWLLAGLSVVPVLLASRLHHEVSDIGVPVARPQQSLAEVRDTARRLLPGCRVRRRFYYRYLLTWDRPEQDPEALAG